MSEYVGFKLKPVYSLIGRKYGKRVQEINKIFQGLSQWKVADAKAELESNATLRLEIGGEEVYLLPEEVDISIQDKDGYVTETEGELFVALETELTEELIQEGFAREIVNKVQFMRKEADFNVIDRIRLYIRSTDTVHKVVENYQKYIMDETLTQTIYLPNIGVTMQAAKDAVSDDNLSQTKTGLSHQKEWAINGEEAFIEIEQIS